ncbi:hypothetical protein [Tahibacter sp.]|uniref:hypothetical protein n=1 Tax=Tahibacter sp. TaxID=2056211 RepID=UPI0028C3C089|nr:hypothetical protein [Tahibacter sp.]
MIFVLATDDRSLHVFADADQAISYCEGIDVEDGVWEFWGPTGEALEAVFSTPNCRSDGWVSSGVYSLQSSLGRPHLLVALERIGHLETNPHFACLAAVRDHLAQCSELQQHSV